MADGNLSRAATIVIPFDDRGDQYFDLIAAGIPLVGGKVRSDLSFAASNPSGYDVCFQGYGLGQDHTPLDEAKAWYLMSRQERGPRLSRRPTHLAVKAVSTHGNPIAEDADFTDCFIVLTYLTGGNAP